MDRDFDECSCRGWGRGSGAGGGAVYGLGIIGACVHYFQHATTFWMVVVGFAKAVVWPAYLLYKLLEYFHF